MNGIHQNGKNRNFEMHPGCLGRMVNLFELNIGVSTNKLLTDKPHRDGSTLSRSRSDISRMSPSRDPIEDKVIINTFSNKKSNGTPMKMLIAQEMSKEVDSRRDPPNLVAKLMGLDALPRHEPDSTTHRIRSRGHHPRSRSDIPMGNWEQQNGLFHYEEPNKNKDAYHRGRYEETTNDKKMAFVRQNFVEAKRLSMDDNLRQSKQFQDALEVLSSNRDLFIKCLQEPKSMFSQHLNIPEHSITPPPETKRITVLRPTKIAGSNSNNFSGAGNNKDGKQMKNELRSPIWSKYENPTQPTRIVVLKPNPGKQDFFGDIEDNENRESREVAKAITQQMREKLGRDDETLVSSVLSNGYAGDESSFNKSEIEFGILSDSEVMSPISRHSWDCPYSSSSFSRASYSPDSSVCREAKKRLSERWTMMASCSNGSYREQRHVQKSSSTLGEMLALSEAKKDSNSHLITRDENVDNSLRNLVRSKSVPVSCTEFGAMGEVEAPSKENINTGSVQSSFTGKVSNLFFSRNRKPSKGEPLKSEIKDDSSDRIESLGDKEPSSKASLSNPIGKARMISPETIAPGNLGETQDQLSPVSVLDPPFKEEEHKTKEFPHYVKPDRQGVEPPLNSIGSNLIGKSPPIGSIARTLSWDESCVETASSHPTKKSLSTDDEEQQQQEWFHFVKKLLSTAGLQGQVRSSSFLARWHSPESPLDPSLRDNYINPKHKEMFDCINAALTYIGRYMSGPVQLIGLDYSVEDELWARMSEWFSSKGRCVSDECGDEDNLGNEAERVVRDEIEGKGWFGHFTLEMGNLGNEMARELLEEILHEVVVELTGSRL